MPHPVVVACNAENLSLALFSNCPFLAAKLSDVTAELYYTKVMQHTCIQIPECGADCCVNNLEYVMYTISTFSTFLKNAHSAAYKMLQVWNMQSLGSHFTIKCI